MRSCRRGLGKTTRLGGGRFFFSSRRRHTRSDRDWSSDVCSSDLGGRCFLRVADYRALAERIRAGDLTDLLSADLFSNVIFGASQDLADLAARVAESARDRESVV